MAALQALKPEEWDKLFEGDNLDIKEAAVLNKYFVAFMQLLTQKDTKAASMINYAMLLKGQIGMNKVFGQGVVLKSMFIKDYLIGGVKYSD